MPYPGVIKAVWKYIFNR
ncbi:Protein of unknown function [Bacillus toyonensis]|nr:Protein of unknown function [Bacillus toyonensis]